jgi:hypothetical protein
MPGSFQFTCPECGQQMMLPADTVGQEGICPGCQQVVTIRPDALDLKTVATPLVPLPPASPDPGVHSPQLAPAESDQRVNEVSGVYIPRSLLFLVGIGGSVVLLVAILLLLVGGADPPADDPSATTQKAAADYSSPEGLGAMLLSALQSGDKKQFLLAVPTVKEYRGWIKQVRDRGVTDEQERKLKRMEHEVDDILAAWQGELDGTYEELIKGFPVDSGRFNNGGTPRLGDWTDTELVIVVSDYDRANPTIQRNAGIDAHLFSDLFVVFKAKGDQYVLWLDDGVGIHGRWYLADPKSSITRLDDPDGFKNDTLRKLLEKKRIPGLDRIPARPFVDTNST